MSAHWEEEEGEPEGWAFHEEPGQGWGDGGPPPWTAVLAVGGLEEKEREGSEWGGDEEREETVVIDILI